MRLFRFDAGVAHSITQFGSSRLMLSPIQQTGGQIQIVCMHVGPGGVVGEHPAQSPQLFLVVQGEGWVYGADHRLVAIRTGQAAFWESGESHASSSDTGMTAIVIEGEALDPGQLMPEGIPPWPA